MHRAKPAEEELSEPEEEERYNSQDDEETKDEKIARQDALIQKMQKDFATTIASLRHQFNEYVEESTQMQEDMINRIRELKDEVNSLRGSPKHSPPKSARTNVRSSLYQSAPKHPRKLAQAGKADEARASQRK